MTGSRVYEFDFDPDATNNTAATVYRLALREGGRLLDLGSGPGIVAGALAAAGIDVTCLDADPESIDEAKKRGVARAVVGDLNGSAWVDAVIGDPYDVIILADVLEHLTDPGRVLDLITEHGLLADQGKLVISIPNVAHESVIANLIVGNFPYTETGLLDRTHIRFFTLATFRALCESHGYLIRTVDRTTRTIEQTELFTVAREVAPSFRKELREAGEDAATYQFIMTAEPASAAREVAALREDLEQERQARISVEERLRAGESRKEEETALRNELEEDLRRLQEHARSVDDLRRQVDVLHGQRDAETAARDAAGRRYEELRRQVDVLHGQRDAETAARKAAGKRYEELRRAHEQQEQQLRRLEAKLEDVYSSETWRAGRAVLWLPKVLMGRRSTTARRSRESAPSPTGKKASGDDEHRPVVPSPNRLALDLDPGASARSPYEEAVGRRSFDPGKRGIVFAVSTTDLDAGRGDLFTSIGLGLALEPLGWQAVYLAPDDWYAPPGGTEVYVSLLAEPSIGGVDPTRLHGVPTLVAWVRNNTGRWIERGRLPFYDAVLCSSEITRDRIQAACDAPVDILRTGVDPHVFTPEDPEHGHGVVATINQWGQPRRTYQCLDELADGGQLDFPLGIYGIGRGISPTLQSFSHGKVAFFSLPSLYHQAGIVLDDQQGVNAPFGNVNSRVFEALSSGALPITASRRGLESLGLGDLPTFATAAELRHLVEQYSDPATRAPVVARLRETVLERHTYDVRAREFEDFVSGLDEATRAVSHPAPVIGFHPDYRVTNPYQDMVYASLEGTQAALCPDVPLGDFLRARNPLDRRRVFHQHWTATILGPSVDDDDARRRIDEYLRDIDSFRGQGGRFVWTIHNVMPHECPRPDLERELRQGIADRADAIHVMCGSTVDLVRAVFELPSELVHVIPHPSYEGVYPNVVDRETAREELGLGSDDFVYLCLGQIRRYKGTQRLLSSFEEVHARDPGTRLLLSGAPGRFAGVKELVARAELLPGVTVVAREIPDEELQLHLAASDVVVLPHRRVLNSGLAMLAITFGRPVVAPTTGCLRELVTPELGVTFDPDAASLAPAMLDARGLDVDTVRKHASALSERLRPSQVSQDLVRLLLEDDVSDAGI